MFFLGKFNKNLKIFSNIQKLLNLSPKFLLRTMEPEIKNQSNKPDTFRGVPETLRYKPQPEFSIRDVLRVQTINSTPEKYFDTVQVVCGWSRTIRSQFFVNFIIIFIKNRPQANDTLVFIELTDGSCFKGLQVLKNFFFL